MADFFVPPVLKHYRIEREAGPAEAGALYAGRDRRDGSAVAITALRPGLLAERGGPERFLAEAQLATTLRSPFTVKVLDYGIEDGLAFIVSEHDEGELLSTILARGPLDGARAAALAHDAARSLEEAEVRGVVHGSIRPSNVVVISAHSGKVMGYGLPAAGDGGRTASGAFTGSMPYAAPELAGADPDARSDVYALGATLLAMLTGRDPAPAGAGGVRELSNLPPPLASIIARCMASDPEDRYRTASELAGALSRVARATAAPGAEPARAPAPAEPPRSFAAPPPPQPTAAPTVIQRDEPAPIMSGRLTASGWASSRHASFDYELTLENRGQRPATVDVRGSDAAGALRIGTPAQVVVAPGQPARVGITVAAARRGWFGETRSIPFQLVAQDRSSGGPPLTFAGEFRDEPDRRARTIALASAGAIVAVLLVIVLGVSGVFGGGSPAAEDDDESPTPTSRATTRATASPNAEVTSTADTVAPPRSISVGQWDYAFLVERNTCGGDPIAGVEFNFSYLLNEIVRPPDGYISAGEEVDIYQVDGGYLGKFKFTYPRFTFEYDVPDGRAVLVNTYTDANYGTATLTETYTGNDGRACEIFLTDK